MGNASAMWPTASKPAKKLAWEQKQLPTPSLDALTGPAMDS